MKCRNYNYNSYTSTTTGIIAQSFNFVLQHLPWVSVTIAKKMCNNVDFISVKAMY